MARSGAALVRRALAALALCYIAGVFAYLALPSLGPALVESGRYAALSGSQAFTLQQSMLAALRYTVQNPQAPAAPFFGLAAFPSLHLATTALGLFVAWKSWRPLLFLLVPWNLAIAASAVYFGWHYVVDFYPALLLAALCWWATGRLTAPLAPARPPQECRPERDDSTLHPLTRVGIRNGRPSPRKSLAHRLTCGPERSTAPPGEARSARARADAGSGGHGERRCGSGAFRQ